MKQFRYPAKRYDVDGRHTGPGPWLALIHATNALAPGSFGNPTEYTADPYTEHYDGFRVVMHGDDTVSVYGDTEEADDLLERADAMLDEAARAFHRQRLCVEHRNLHGGKPTLLVSPGKCTVCAKVTS